MKSNPATRSIISAAGAFCTLVLPWFYMLLVR